ncbi:hypothetical protein NGB36_02310 [Streptomyces sp. RB6PN25]|uniref:Outer membrane channel protein CpnT-like N-terminal domain-containing protein n=1 Tax=Streptomyces humicola TaxID=2953240 RepID=A0ABT1PSC4_9ACTN|nr:hypothetical protein [Streptomyces humicola]MCQ4079462.1 hypothetical protein [Streptomyces humicola]
MAINLPHWLVEIVGVLGFNWPEIDEDQLREAAKHLRSYADECERSHDKTHGVITGDLPQVYKAQSYTALAQVWSEQSSGHMKDMIEACRLFADGLEIAAVGVEGMKGEVIAQLVIAAAEFVADQAAAVVTFGIAEAAEVVFLEAQNKILNAIMQRFESEVIGKLVNATLGPAEEQVERAAQRLMFMEAGQLAVGGPPPALALDTDAIRAHGETLKGEADANMEGGRSFANKVGALTFTTGG